MGAAGYSEWARWHVEGRVAGGLKLPTFNLGVDTGTLHKSTYSQINVASVVWKIRSQWICEPQRTFIETWTCLQLCCCCCLLWTWQMWEENPAAAALAQTPSKPPSAHLHLHPHIWKVPGGWIIGVKAGLVNRPAAFRPGTRTSVWRCQNDNKEMEIMYFSIPH